VIVQGSDAASAGRPAVGDGALRFRDDLEGAGCGVGSDRHGVGAPAVCRLAPAGTEHDLVVPDPLRTPDAVPSKP
jgi:hypothetical protein